MRGALMQGHDEDERIDDSDDAKPMESGVPREEGGHGCPEPADGLPRIEARHVDTDRQRTSLPLMPVGNEREGRGNIEGFADAHHGAQPIELLEGGGIAHQKRDGRPYEKTAHHEPFAVELVCDDARDRAHESVDPQKDGHQCAESLGFVQFGDVSLHSRLHGG